ncbi:MAG: hypothetical protein ACXAD7_08640 [Candidatus Kariarchaeaceae archaeon]
MSVAHACSRPILYMGNGQSYDDLIPFDANLIINQVIPN